MDYINYEVQDILKALDGHESDRIIKIKLADGTTLPVAGIEFRNACIGGDDILYVKELDPLWIQYHKEVKSVAYHLHSVAKELDCAIKSKALDDTDWALSSMIFVAQECDYWLDKLKIKHEFEPGTGPDNEIFDKIKLLEKWVKSY